MGHPVEIKSMFRQHLYTKGVVVCNILSCFKRRRRIFRVSNPAHEIKEINA